MDNFNKLNLDLLKDVVPFGTLPTLAQLNLKNIEKGDTNNSINVINSKRSAINCSTDKLQARDNKLTNSQQLCKSFLNERKNLSECYPFFTLTNSSPLPSSSSQLIIKSELNTKQKTCQ